MKDIFQIVPETEVLTYLFKSREFTYELDSKTLQHPYVIGVRECMLATYRYKLSAKRFVDSALRAGVIMARYKFIDDDDDLVEKGDYLLWMKDVIDHPNKSSAGSESYFGGTGRGMSSE